MAAGARSDYPTVAVQPTASDTRIETATPTFTDRSAQPLPQLEPGERIGGRYVVTGLLGRGGFGEVYRVRDEQRHGEELALKLHRLGAHNRHALAALAGEFELLSSLSHPNLARVYDFGHVSDLAAFFTEDLVPGERLDRSGLRPDDPAAMPFWTQLCRALEYLHSRGILHRDIKPSNVIVDRAGARLTLLDFGVSRVFGASEEQYLAGTMAYLAPESIAGGPVDARADLYALGITFHQLLTGRLPFRGSDAEILRAHVSEQAPDLDDRVVRPAVGRVVERLVRKEPGERYASAAEVLDALARANGVEVAERPRDELASYVLSARFVGRADALLDDVVRRAGDELRGETVVIEGEAGSGKSRLLREARRRAQLAGHGWVEVPRQHWSADRPLLLDLARAVITPAVAAQLDEDDRVSLARALPELRRRRERIADPVDPEREREARHRALARAVSLRFERIPGVLAIEDLHWATADQVAVLERILAHLRADGARCLVVLTARPGGVVEAMARRLAADTLRCPALDPADSARLLESMFGQADLLRGTPLGDALSSRAHPALYVQESLRLALERGSIRRREGRWIVAEAVPALGLGEVLEARIGHLSGAGRRLALAAAVLGGHGTGAEIATVAGQPLRRSAAALRQLVRAGILEGERQAGDVIGYTMHDRFIDVVVARATESERRATHRRAGRMLRRVARGDWRTLLPAADQLALAGDEAGALELCERAATEALRHGHPQQALAAVAREVALRERDGGEAPVAVLLRRFDLALRCGDEAALDGALAALATRDRTSSEGETIAIELRRTRALARRGDLEGARPRCAAALARARALGDRALEGELLVLTAEMDDEVGDVRRSMEGFVAAAEIALERGSVVDEARARLGASLSALRLGDIQASGALARRAIEILRDPGELQLRSEALRALGNVRRETGDVSGSLRAYRKAVRAARDAGAVESEAKALNNLGTVAQWAGHVAEGEEALLRAMGLKHRVGARASALLSEINLASLLLCTGRLAEAERILANRVESVPGLMSILCRSNLGDVLTTTGRLDEALALYRRSREEATSLGMPQQASHTLTGLIRALVMRNAPGDLDEARELLVGFERLHVGGGLVESGRRFHTTAAMVADLEGDIARALGHARSARASEEEQRMHFTDLFGTRLEARWMEAILASRAGRPKTALRKVRRVRSLLSRLAGFIQDAEQRRRFLEGLPVNRAIQRGDLDLPRGWTFRPEDAAACGPGTL